MIMREKYSWINYFIKTVFLKTTIIKKNTNRNMQLLNSENHFLSINYMVYYTLISLTNEQKRYKNTKIVRILRTLKLIQKINDLSLRGDNVFKGRTSLLIYPMQYVFSFATILLPESKNIHIGQVSQYKINKRTNKKDTKTQRLCVYCAH